VRLSESVLSYIEVELMDGFDPEFDPPETELFLSLVDTRRGEMLLPTHPDDREALFRYLMDLANDLDEDVRSESSLSSEERKYLRNVSKSFGTLAGKVLRS
jgi:hypothetical protein